MNTEAIRDMVIQAADRSAEALAHAEDLGDMDEQALDNLRALHLAIWRVRWELGAPGGSVAYETLDPREIVYNEANGASAESEADHGPA